MDWIQWAREFGFPTTILVILLLGLAWLVRWALANLAIPIRDAHIEYLRDEKVVRREQAETMTQQGSDIRDIRGVTNEIHSKVSDIYDWVKKD